MSTVTSSEVNRRIAIWMGHRDFEYVTLDDGSLMARRTSDGAALHEFPDYMHDANAVLQVVERVCRERELDVQMHHPGIHRAPRYFVLFAELKQTEHGTRTVAGHSQGSTLSEAASLALFAVLGEGS